VNLDIADLFISYFTLLFALCVHEASHAAMANRCGDPSARLLGRMTLDPMKHIDPLGTVILPILMMVMPGGMLFGWAKPVPFNPVNLKNIRRDPVLIALAGPGSNLIMAICCAFVMRILVLVGGIEPLIALLDYASYPEAPMLFVFWKIVYQMLIINLVLMIFNMIPVPPLDGHHVLSYFLPPSGQEMMQRIGPFGLLIVIMFVAQPVFSVVLPVLHFVALKIATIGYI
jgi:Zn-dependent protease